MNNLMENYIRRIMEENEVNEEEAINLLEKVLQNGDIEEIILEKVQTI